MLCISQYRDEDRILTRIVYMIDIDREEKIEIEKFTQTLSHAWDLKCSCL